MHSPARKPALAAATLIALAAHAWSAPLDEPRLLVTNLTRQVQASEQATLALRQQLADAHRALREALAGAPPSPTALQFVIPRLATPPVMDGAISPGEWDAAVVIPSGTGASNQGQPLRAREAPVYFVGWDAENLYVAHRMPMREGEMPVRLCRKPQRDSMEPWETVVEAYIDRSGNGSHGLPARWQFIGNAAGNRWDREDQYTIGQNVVEWNGEWTFQQRLTPDGKYWEAELAFPRKTVYQAEPLRDGDRWKIGLAGSLQHPWQWSGFYGWPIAATFRDEAPSVRMFHPERGVLTKRMAFDFEVANTTPRPFAAELVARLWDPAAADRPALIEKRMAVAVEPGATFRVAVDEDAAAARDMTNYRFTVMLLQGDVSLYTWDLGLRFNDPENLVGLKVETSKEPFPLRATYYPLSNQLKVTVDKYDLPDREALRTVRFDVRAESGGAVLGSGTISRFDYEQGHTSLALPADLKPGRYACRATLLDAAGHERLSHSVPFERKDHAREFPWLGTRVGCDDVVPRNFEPVEVDGTTVRGYRKELRLDGSALPVSIRAMETELLSGPVRLRGIAAGTAFEVVPSARPARRTAATATHAEFSGEAAGGPVRASAAFRFDYDGTARIELTLAPAAKGGVAKLDALQLVIPFHSAAATRFMANGSNMRLSNRAGALPGAGTTGTVWRSTEVRAQSMTVGSFIPIVHVGNLSCGLTWFADSDEGWWPSDARPALELVRAGTNTVELVCNLASEPVELREPRRLVFGLCTVPVRKVTPYRATAHTIGFGFERESGRWDPTVTPERVYARVYPDNPARFREWVQSLHAQGALEKAYVENSSADYWAREFSYFAPEWASQFTRSSADCKLWWTERFIRDTDLDGYYFDNIYCRLYSDPDVTSAYPLPDGRVQPGYDLWDARDYFRRIRVAFEKSRNPTAIVFHNTDFQFAPIMGYADLVMGGENPTPAKGTPDFMDMWPRDWMDVMYNPGLWGYSLSHLYHYNTASFTDEAGDYDRAAALKGHRTAMAGMLVHGVEFFQGIEYQGFLMPRYRLFKALAGEAEFIPSWQAAGRFRLPANTPDLDVAVWRKPGALLIVAANYGRAATRQEVWFDFPALLAAPGPMETRMLLDLENLEMPGFIVKDGGWPAGTIRATALRLEVGARDFRAYLLMNAPAAQGAGF